MKTYQLLPLIFTCVLFLNSTCEDECPHELGAFGYVLHAEVTLTPLQETYRVGDTIDVAFRLPGEILNQGTSSFVSLKNVDISTGSSNTRIDAADEISDLQSDMFYDFKFLGNQSEFGEVELERINSTTSFILGKPERNTTSDYVHFYSFVTKSPGLYYFSFGPFSFEREPGSEPYLLEIENECETSKLLFAILTGGTDENLDLLCEGSISGLCVTDEPRRSLNYEDYRRRATHVFRVVE